MKGYFFYHCHINDLVSYNFLEDNSLTIKGFLTQLNMSCIHYIPGRGKGTLSVGINQYVQLNIGT